MKVITQQQITHALAEACVKANCVLGTDVFRAIKQATQKETEILCRDALVQCYDNACIAQHHGVPLCQDTGTAVIFAKIGQDIYIQGDFNAAVEEGVRQGYKNLRKSMRHPLTGKNTGDNTPAVVHAKWVKGDKLTFTVVPKGGGSENMSRLMMLKPSDGLEGIKNFVLDTVKQAGGNPCPPLIVGVGIGGNFESCALLAKEALLREVGSLNDDESLRPLEDELLTAINALGIGTQGWGGSTTALAVHVKVMPCHIASLPVAVNLQCHVARHITVVLEGAEV